MFRNIVYDKLVVHGCIHKLENECDVLNKELGDCEIECENKIVWRCPFSHLNIRKVIS